MTPFSHTQKGFSIESSKDSDGTLKLTFVGDASLGIEVITRGLTWLHAQAMTSKLPKVVVDIRGTTFVNSSGFKCFASWLTQVNKADNRYGIVIRSNPEVYWQARSLRALKAFAPEVFEVDAS